MIPEGLVAYGWHSYASGGLSAMAKDSACHLAPASQVYTVRGGTVERVAGPALCGRSMVGRAPKPDTPGSVAADLLRGQRKPCTRCFAAAER